jgi:2-polyprenyl-6-methoxyphenol hydroxylase-like FAD-dependent oxidoreductase
VKGRAEIVGAGLAGLAAAVALARRGWSVRVHERAAELREIGAGLYLKENGLRALDDMGVAVSGLSRAVRLDHMDIVDLTSGQTLSRDVQGVRVYAPPSARPAAGTPGCGKAASTTFDRYRSRHHG